MNRRNISVGRPFHLPISEGRFDHWKPFYRVLLQVATPVQTQAAEVTQVGISDVPLRLLKLNVPYSFIFYMGVEVS